jgi:ParB-like chromosome segregation protein Spo0J
MSLVLDVPIDRLATTLAPLRGPRTDLASPLAPLPLRVAPTDAGTYEVLDGFKRLAHWTRAGHRQVPVVVEDATGIVAKARLLEANAPRRTLSPMDEARVVRSLADDDHLTPTQIAKLLGRGRGWVDRRLTLGRRLAPDVEAHVDAGRLSATTATAPAARRPAAPGGRRDAPRPAHAGGRGLSHRLAGRGRPAHARGTASRPPQRGARSLRGARLAPGSHGARAPGALRPDRGRPGGARPHRLHRP